MARRRNTKLEAEGAEFLVLGNLLLNQISTFKAYTNFPGYDLIATNAESNTAARVQGNRPVNPSVRAPQTA